MRDLEILLCFDGAFDSLLDSFKGRDLPGKGDAGESVSKRFPQMSQAKCHYVAPEI